MTCQIAVEGNVSTRMVQSEPDWALTSSRCVLPKVFVLVSSYQSTRLDLWCWTLWKSLIELGNASHAYGIFRSAQTLYTSQHATLFWGTRLVLGGRGRHRNGTLGENRSFIGTSITHFGIGNLGQRVS